MPIEVHGLADLKASLKETDGASVKEISAALKEGAVKVTAAAKGHIHSVSGELAADARPYSTVKSAGVRFTLVYAPVVEFAGTWHRRPKGHGEGSGAGPKGRADRKILQATGTGEVHHTGATPRFAFRAVDELAPGFMVETFDRLCDVARAHGWFDESGG